MKTLFCPTTTPRKMISATTGPATDGHGTMTKYQRPSIAGDHAAS